MTTPTDHSGGSDVDERPFYRCPNGHEWIDASEVEAPLANIKCPHCGVTAVRWWRVRPRGYRNVQPLREIRMTVPPWPRKGE